MSRILLVVLVCALSSATMFGQKLLIEIDTQEGQLLQQIDNEKDAAKSSSFSSNLRLSSLITRLPHGCCHTFSSNIWRTRTTTRYSRRAQDPQYRSSGTIGCP